VDNTRLFLVCALAFVGLLLWQEWQRDYGAKTAPAHATEAVPAPLAADTPPAVATPQTPGPVPVPGSPDAGALSTARLVTVTTDTFAIAIDTAGATIKRLALPRYPIELEAPDPLKLFDDSGDRFFVLQGGLTGADGLPDHRAVYRSDREQYSLAAGSDALEVRFTWRGTSGIEVDKVYEFRRGSYAFGIHHEVRNPGPDALTVRQYQQLQRRAPDSSRGLVPTFTGAALSSPEKRYQKHDFDDLREDPIDLRTNAGWIGFLQHYFVAALVPAAADNAAFYSKALPEERYLVGVQSPAHTVAPGGTARFDLIAYVGPKIQDDLEKLAPGLDLVVDYGSLWFIAKPLFRGMQWFHRLTRNWGWSIVLLTVVVKLLFFYPSALGYRSMARMRKVTPRLQAIRERYAEDRARQQQAMLELYKEEKINPLSGCLPILIQIPVFIALYWVLLESVELRQAPFVLWLRDLSAPDPYFALPLLMGVTMYVQQKLNPAPLDPVQQRVMQIMPVVFTIMFAWFPAGLVLYWTVSNILSIGQQWLITRQIEAA
jgi:YidC/Oxa1 family membrane protein insertase